MNTFFGDDFFCACVKVVLSENDENIVHGTILLNNVSNLKIVLNLGRPQLNKTLIPIIIIIIIYLFLHPVHVQVYKREENKNRKHNSIQAYNLYKVIHRTYKCT